MSRFLAYCTYEDDNAQAMTEEEYKQGLFNKIDWEEYVWIEAETKSEALALYDQAMGEYETDLKEGREPKHTY